ncbi:MAG: hypothetical protein HYW47_05400 [Deltaproteobacteria bacterium]|nr:hypothetical protein [Deltaproteobacteria bacterium]
MSVLYTMEFKRVFDLLLKQHGPQNWWPGETSFEVMIGAILTQNTSWTNVEKAILNLKNKKILDPHKMLRVHNTQLAKLIRPSGYFNQKANKLKNYLNFFKNKYGFFVQKMKKESVEKLRNELLEVNGIGPETADSILLYALEKPIFVIDAYTKRIFSRLSLCRESVSYYDLQSIFMTQLPQKTSLYNEYHALIVHHGKNICKKSKPRCGDCSLQSMCPQTSL